MPRLRVHCRISKDRTGFNFKQLHQWIDEPYKKLGSDHRILRHAYTHDDERTIERYWEKERGKGWGKKAVVEWLFHIAMDNLETAFKEANQVYKNGRAYNFCKVAFLPNSKYILFHCDRLDDAQLKDVFDNYILDDDSDEE